MCVGKKKKNKKIKSQLDIKKKKQTKQKTFKIKEDDGT